MFSVCGESIEGWRRFSKGGRVVRYSSLQHRGRDGSIFTGDTRSDKPPLVIIIAEEGTS